MTDGRGDMHDIKASLIRIEERLNAMSDIPDRMRQTEGKILEYDKGITDFWAREWPRFLADLDEIKASVKPIPAISAKLDELEKDLEGFEANTKERLAKHSARLQALERQQNSWRGALAVVTVIGTAVMGYIVWWIQQIAGKP
jgi:anti-sigma-K factor RskA